MNVDTILAEDNCLFLILSEGEVTFFMKKNTVQSSDKKNPQDIFKLTK